MREHVVHLAGQPLPLGQRRRPDLSTPGLLQFQQQPLGLDVPRALNRPAPPGCSQKMAAEPARNSAQQASWRRPGARWVASTPTAPTAIAASAADTASPVPCQDGAGVPRKARTITSSPTTRPSGRSQRSAASCRARARRKAASVGVVGLSKLTSPL
jgi:hypothetical protein